MTSDLPPAGGPNPANSSGTTGGATSSAPSGSSVPGASGPSGSAGGGPSAPQQGPRGLNDFFGWIRGFGIYRRSEGRWGAGVASALAHRWGIDPILIRGLFVALTFAGGLGIALYGFGWLLLPQQDGRIHLQQAVHGHFTWGFAGAAVLSLSVLGHPGPWDHDGWFGGPPQFLIWIGLIALIWWIVRRGHVEGWHGQWQNPNWQNDGWQGHGWQGRTAQPVPAASPGGAVPEYGSPDASAQRSAPGGVTDGPGYGAASSGVSPAPWSGQPGWTPQPVPDLSRPLHGLTRATLGLALLVAAAVLIGAQAFDLFDAPAGLIAAAAALAVVALGTIVAGLLGRRAGGLAGIGLLLLAGVLIGTGVHNAGVRPGQNFAAVGNYRWTPTSPAQAEREYNLGLGQGELLLTDPGIIQGATAADPVRVHIRLGAGQLTVVTPQGVPASVNVQLGAGQVTTPDGVQHDRNPDSSQDGVFIQHTGTKGDPVLVVDVQQGAGDVVIQERRPASTVQVTPSASVTAPAKKESSNA